jgi:hypothetical protein
MPLRRVGKILPVHHSPRSMWQARPEPVNSTIALLIAARGMAGVTQHGVTPGNVDFDPVGLARGSRRSVAASGSNPKRLGSSKTFSLSCLRPDIRSLVSTAPGFPRHRSQLRSIPLSACSSLRSAPSRACERGAIHQADAASLARAGRGVAGPSDEVDEYRRDANTHVSATARPLRSNPPCYARL